GSEYTCALAAAGAAVAACDLAAAPRPRAQRAIDTGAPISFFSADAANRRAMDAVVAGLARTHGAPTILINNAGLGSSPADAALEPGPFQDYPDPAWRALFASP